MSLIASANWKRSKDCAINGWLLTNWKSCWSILHQVDNIEQRGCLLHFNSSCNSVRVQDWFLLGSSNDQRRTCGINSKQNPINLRNSCMRSTFESLFVDRCWRLLPPVQGKEMCMYDGFIAFLKSCRHVLKSFQYSSRCGGSVQQAMGVPRSKSLRAVLVRC